MQPIVSMGIYSFASLAYFTLGPDFAYFFLRRIAQ